MFRSFIAPLAGVVLLAASGGAQAAIHSYGAEMLGSNEVPPTGTEATGFTMLSIDDLTDLMSVHVEFAGLVAPAAAAHIHCCTPIGTNIGVAVPFGGFPAATSGIYDHVFNLLDPAIYTNSFRTNFGGGTAAGAEAALLAGLAHHQAYSNIHDTVFPGGEIRGFLAAVPEPGTWALLVGGLGLTGAALRRRRLALA